ncbi:MAG: SMP-30/gluconolactonase/LRE family protein [Acidobacteria bacterium]|nr:SMP-30/gluconolactonase/LRE family protein [Acidobacteriota bacterium]
MIEARVPAFRQIVAPRSEIVPVLSELGSPRGIVCGRTGIVSIADVAHDKVYEYVIPRRQTAPNGGVLRPHRLDIKGAVGLTLDHQGRLLIAGRNPAQVGRIEVNGTLHALTQASHPGHPRHPADLVYAIDGHVYVADLPPTHPDGGPSQGSAPGAIYQIARNGSVQPVSPAPLRPAGVALDCRQLHLLVADRLSNSVQRFPIAPDGSLGPSATVFERAISDAIGGGGIETDEAGNIYVTTPEGVQVHNTDGIELGAIRLPEPPADLCWGRGAVGLYATAGSGVYFIPIEVGGTRTF